MEAVDREEVSTVAGGRAVMTGSGAAGTAEPAVQKHWV